MHFIARTQNKKLRHGLRFTQKHTPEHTRTPLAAAVSQFPLSQHLIEFYCKLKKETANCKIAKQRHMRKLITHKLRFGKQIERIQPWLLHLYIA